MPDGWRDVNLADITSLIRNGFSCNQDKNGLGSPVTRIETISNGTINYERVGFTNAPIDNSYRLKSGDILFSHINSLKHIGKVAIYDDTYPLYHGMNLMLIRCQQSCVNPLYVYYILSDRRAKAYFENHCKQAINQASLNQRDISQFQFTLPPLPEQKKIAAILSSVDDTIQATQGVIDQTRRVKQGLLLQLLTRGIGHTRFKQTEIGEIPEEWNVHQIGNLFKQVRKPVSVEKESHYQELGIRSHGKGIFHKDKIIGEKLGNKRVFWIEPNCLILNIVFAWERAVAVTNNQEKGMIASHRFPMFKPDEARILLPFIILYFHSLKGMHALGSISPGGAGRNKTLSQKAFLKLPIPVPPLSEQTRIAEAISKIDNALSMEQQKLESLNRTKRGLMQNLLTGRVHVNCVK